MDLGKIALETENILGHAVALGIGIDAIRNLYNGVVTGNQSYYQTAIVEMIASAGIETAKYLSRRREKVNSKYIEGISEKIKKLSKIDEELGKRISCSQ